MDEWVDRIKHGKILTAAMVASSSDRIFLATSCSMISSTFSMR
jgi:hypothetical protein